MLSKDLEDKVLSLLVRSDTCLVTSIDEKGYPTVRAMLKPREITGMKTFAFGTNTSSRHVGHYQSVDKASLYFYDPQLFQGLLFRGRMETTSRQELRDGLWRDGDNVYYQLGPTDPDYCVMLFTADNGRWYENLHSLDFTIS